MGDVVEDPPARAWRGRRDARWLALWPFDVLAGGLYGFALVWVAVLYVLVQQEGDGLELSPFVYLARSVGFGLGYALFGLVCGLPVGLALTFLVGDATGVAARRAAVVVAALAHLVAGALLLVLLGGVTFGGGLWLVVLSALTGAAAGWWHDRLASRPRQDDFYAH